jgi:putative Mn2+ efflux pump MntP
VLALLLVAVSVGLDNLGASAAIGLSGVDRRLRVRIALIFGVFEATMPIVGLLLGRSLAHDLGSAAKPIGGALLGLVGTYVIVTELVGEQSKGANKAEKVEPSIKRLVIMGAALSIDNLVIGFALGASHTNLLIAAVTIGLVSVALSLVGLEIGSRLGGRLGQRSELVGGAVLILVGVAIGTGLI